MSLYLKDGHQFLNALDTIIEFDQVSGLMLNPNKREGLWLGSLTNCNMHIQGFKWPNPIRYLGVYVGRETNGCNKSNWDDKILTF